MLQEIYQIFRRPTPEQRAALELADAELSLLEARTAHEYAASVIMYRETQTNRLREFLGGTR